MKVSNLRVENVIKENKRYTRIICDVTAGFTDTKQLYFSVSEKYGNWLTSDVYDAFLVAAIYPAMYYNEPIEIEGNVTKSLYHNVVTYVEAIVKQYDLSFHIVPVKVGGYAFAQKNSNLHVGTGFSGGVDSFSTLKDWFFDCDDNEYKIDTLFFFHVGQYGNIKNPLSGKRAINRFSITKQFADSIGVPAIMMETNLFEFYLPKWEYDAGEFCRILSVLVFQRALKRFYISNADTYRELSLLSTWKVADLEDFCGQYMKQLLSPRGLDIVYDGAQYKRSEKILRIIDMPAVHQFLNVCVNSMDDHVSATNCSMCSKCLRTLWAIESLDGLSKVADVFNLRKWNKIEWRYKCHQVILYNRDAFAKDNIDFARSHGKHVPSRLVAYPYVYTSKIYHLICRIIKLK